jgi:y4mF family transcriptional regulator
VKGLGTNYTYRTGRIMAVKPTTLEQIGRTVRSVRKAQGLKQVDLAGLANVGARFVIELEAGKPTIQMGKALKVMETLGCRLTVATPPDLSDEGKP